MASNSSIYIHESRSLCFSCGGCNSSLSWNILSYNDHIWRNITDLTLQSQENKPESLFLFSNGTLLVTNSSLFFSKSVPGILSFSELSSQNHKRSQYTVYIGGMTYHELKINHSMPIQNLYNLAVYSQLGVN